VAFAGQHAPSLIYEMTTQMPIGKPTDSRRFCTLDGMRGSAALLVAAYHFPRTPEFVTHGRLS